MAGIIRGFIGGLGTGAAKAGELMLADQIRGEREEANALRDYELRSKEREDTQSHETDLAGKRMDHDANLQDDQQAHTADLQENKQLHESGESDKDRKLKTFLQQDEQDWKSIENALDRANDLKVADAKSTGSGATSQMKNAAALMKQGYPQDIANAIAHGGFKTHTNKDGDQIVVMPQANGSMIEVGKIVEGSNGKMRWTGYQPGVGNDPTADDIKRAQEDYEKATKDKGWFESDKDILGQSKRSYLNQKAQEYADQRGQGIVNSATGGSEQKKPEKPAKSGKSVTEDQYRKGMIRQYPELEGDTATLDDLVQKAREAGKIK